MPTIALFFAVLCALRSSVAQQSPLNQPGTPAFTASFAPDDLDSVNLVNGNVSLKIPMISFPQVGGKLKMDFFYYYNSPQPIGDLEDPVYNINPSSFDPVTSSHYFLIGILGNPNSGVTYPTSGFAHSQQLSIETQNVSIECPGQDCGGPSPISSSNSLPHGGYESATGPGAYDGTGVPFGVGCNATAVFTSIGTFGEIGQQNFLCDSTQTYNPIARDAVLGKIVEGDGTSHTYSMYIDVGPAYHPLMTGDGSGYLPIVKYGPLSPYPTGSNFLSNANYLDSILDRDGISYTFKDCQANPIVNRAFDQNVINQLISFDLPNSQQNACPPAMTGLPALMDRTDSNGNAIVDSYAGWTDTAQRFIPHENNTSQGDLSLCSAGATSAQLWTVPGIDNGTMAFTRCYTSQSSVGYYSPTSLTGVYIYSWFPDACTGNCPLSTIYESQTGAIPGSTLPAVTSTTPILHEIVLPNGSRYTLDFDGAGFLHSYTTPSGARVTYTYTYILWDTCNPYAPYKAVPTTRTVDDANGNISVWKYQWQVASCVQAAPDANVQVTITDPLNNDTIHQHYGGPDPGLAPSSLFAPYTYIGVWTRMQEVTASYSGAGSARTLLKTVTTTRPNLPSPFMVPRPMGLIGGWSEVYPGPPSQVLTQWADQKTSLTTYTYVPSGTTTTYDLTDSSSIYYMNFPAISCQCLNYSLLRSENEYDYGPSGTGTAGSLLRTTTHTYQIESASNGAAYLAANLFDLPAKTTVQDGSGNLVAETDYTYDNNSPSTLGAQGNLTAVSRWVNTSPSSPSVTNYSYNGQGMLTLETDPNGNKTAITVYQCSGLFPQQIISSYQSSTTASELTSYSYDCRSGKLTSITDPNGVTTKYTYNDPLERLTLIQHAFGTSIESDTAATYPSMTQMNEFQDEHNTGDGTITSSTTYDGLGRPIHLTLPSGALIDTSYDLLGHVSSVANAHFLSVSPTDGITAYSYDALGRRLLQCQPDNGTAPSACTIGASYLQWTYQDNNLTTSDELHNSRQMSFDALGRLTSVVEMPGGANLTTNYQYDPLNDLLSVTQNGAVGDNARIRIFHYDSLSRLIDSNNPETGINTYSYLLGGNLCSGNPTLPCSKTDARGVTVNYLYDALNRLVSKTYSNDPTSSPSSCYQYDSTSTTNGIGKLSAQWTQKGTCPASLGANAITSTLFSAYDAMGRVTMKQQCVLSVCSNNYPSSSPSTYSYDFAGHLTSYDDGLGLTQFTNQFDTAGRLQSVTSSWSDLLHPPTLFSAQSYSPFGGLTSALYGIFGSNQGTALSQTRTFDNRLRITGETNVGNVVVTPALPGSAIINILGSELSK